MHLQRLCKNILLMTSIGRMLYAKYYSAKRYVHCKLDIPDLPISKGKFCDYCSCEDCQDGAKHLSSIPCIGGTNICDVCLYLDSCDAGCSGGDPEQPCKHKPIPVSSEEK